MPDTTSEPKTEKVKRTDQQKSVRSAKSQRSTLSQQKRALIDRRRRNKQQEWESHLLFSACRVEHHSPRLHRQQWSVSIHSNDFELLVRLSLSQHVVGLLANLVDHLPLNTLSFASRTRGKEQTTIMITTASPLCVSILQLRHDYVQATNNICCSTLLIRCEMGKM
ncbi:hypothetical protein BLNAU_13812 [Blattamonas nauphoetae]|uniref:Uncharacterized protein n=1 Tax=Blattamonas nauphoetae TaxID=2049346 RepID=A0ABQ9XGS4_9EUKA|nr:hypothetical protein BLNAU_13812 [Blattamonas nauphoetae]